MQVAAGPWGRETDMQVAARTHTQHQQRAVLSVLLLACNEME